MTRSFNHQNQLIGQPTRGKTARNRLRRTDIFLILYAEHLLRLQSNQYSQPYFVDLGFGAEAHTTLESAQRFRKVNPTLPVLGIEIDPARVAAAKPYEDAITQFRLGGFNIPLQSGETVRLIRAFNVLRQYEEHQVSDAHHLMASQLVPGGLVFEGTSDPYGRIWAANLLRKQFAFNGNSALIREGIVFGTNFRWGFEPAIFQPVLPKNYIHRMQPGESIYEFMQAWKEAARITTPYKTFGLRQWFAASAHCLMQMGYKVELRDRFLKRGFLVWKFEQPLLINPPSQQLNLTKISGQGQLHRIP
jgi:hypothetical protein